MRIHLLLTLAIGIFLQTSAAANIVSYTDENGVVRFTNYAVPERHQQSARVVVANGVFLDESVVVVPPAAVTTYAPPTPRMPSPASYQPARPSSSPTLSPQEQYLEVRPYSDYLKRPEKRSFMSGLKQLLD